MQAQAPIPAERVVHELERVLAGREFRRSNSLLEEFAEWLDRTISPGEIGLAAEALVWGALGLAAVLFLHALWRLRARRGAPAIEAEALPGPGVRERLSELLTLAARARAAGDLRLALRLFLFALIVGLGERGDLRYHGAWTNRELLRRGQPGPAARALLEPLVAELEAKEFGREPVTAADVERLAGLCARFAGHSRNGERAA